MYLDINLIKHSVFNIEGRRYRMSFIAKVLRAIAGLGTSGTVGCAHVWLDEAEMPASLIER